MKNDKGEYVPAELTDLVLDEVSTVDAPAIGEEYAVVKGEDEVTTPVEPDAETMATIQVTIAKAMEAHRALFDEKMAAMQGMMSELMKSLTPEAMADKDAMSAARSAIWAIEDMMYACASLAKVVAAGSATSKDDREKGDKATVQKAFENTQALVAEIQKALTPVEVPAAQAAEIQKAADDALTAAVQKAVDAATAPISTKLAEVEKALVAATEKNTALEAQVQKLADAGVSRSSNGDTASVTKKHNLWDGTVAAQAR